MKSYFLNNIYNQIIKKKFESIVIILIVFFMSASLSLLYFYSYNDSIERNIGNNLELSYEINQNHILSKNSKEINNHLLYFEKLVQWINETGSDERLDYYNYNISITLRGNLNQTSNDSYELYSRFFGINSSMFLNENDIELVDGRFMSQDEIDEGKVYLVVNEDELVYENGQSRKYKIGDLIDLSIISSNQKNESYQLKGEVIGIYKQEEKNEYFTINDRFANSKGILIPNKVLYDLIIHEYENINLDDLFINHIQFNVSDYTNYLEYKNTLENRIIEFDKMMEDLKEPNSKMVIYQSNNGGILESVSQIKSIYNMIFICVFIVITFILIISLYYILKRKTQEISIYYSLGESRLKIMLRFVFVYNILSLFGIILGLMGGYYLSVLLTNSMLNESIQLRMELSRFVSGEVLQEIPNYIPEYFYTLKSSILVVIEIYIIVIFSTIGSMIIILHSKLFKRNGGWNS